MAKTLPYSVRPAGRLVHYMRYLTTPAAEKTRWLMGLAQQDPFYATIITMLQTHGHHITHRFWGHSGAYLPTSIMLAQGGTPHDALDALRDETEPAQFTFSARYGGAQIAHYFLHELMHFWQDAHGLFLTPLQQLGQLPVMLDAESHIAISCMCEAMAETEALRASWRLKTMGYPIAWQGALASFDWRSHARAYATDMATMPEPKAARRAFDRWHASSQRPYVEKRALRAYQEMLSELPPHHPSDLQPQLRHADMAQWLQLLPPAARPDYITLPNETPLNDPFYMHIRHRSTAQKRNATYRSNNAAITDITIGAAPYLWHAGTETLTLHDE